MNLRCDTNPMQVLAVAAAVGVVTVLASTAAEAPPSLRQMGRRLIFTCSPDEIF